MIVLGIIIGLLIAILVVVTEMFFVQRGFSVVKKIRQSTAPKAELIMPDTLQQRALKEKIEKADALGEELQWFEEDIL